MAFAALFFGMKSAVLAIVLEALLRIRKRALTSRLSMRVATAFVARAFCAWESGECATR